MKERGAISLMVGVGWVGVVVRCREVMVVTGWLSGARGFVSWDGIKVLDIGCRFDIFRRSIGLSICMYVCMTALFSLFAAAGYTVNHLNPRMQTSWSAGILPKHWQYHLELSYGMHGVRTVGYLVLTEW
jgi:hypothetical protein